MSAPPVHRQRPTHSTWLLCVLSLALWWSQSLGLVHAVLHGSGLEARVHGQAELAGQADEGQASGGLFSNHHSQADCHAFDALSHADAIAVLPLAVACQATEALLDAQPPSGRIAPQASGFLARGPPLSFLS
jgi:hypothetical protein